MVQGCQAEDNGPKEMDLGPVTTQPLVSFRTGEIFRQVKRTHRPVERFMNPDWFEDSKQITQSDDAGY